MNHPARSAIYRFLPLFLFQPDSGIFPFSSSKFFSADLFIWHDRSLSGPSIASSFPFGFCINQTAQSCWACETFNNSAIVGFRSRKNSILSTLAYCANTQRPNLFRRLDQTFRHPPRHFSFNHLFKYFTHRICSPFAIAGRHFITKLDQTDRIPFALFRRVDAHPCWQPFQKKSRQNNRKIGLQFSFFLGLLCLLLLLLRLLLLR